MTISTSQAFDLAGILLGEDAQEVIYSDDELIPVRILNEFAYCPRLAYLEWVQAEFTDNLDTRQGTFGHRNVDRPSSRPVPTASCDEQTPASIRDPDDVDLVTTRALTLSAYKEGLVAKLDLLELEGSDVTPVEYKKGSIPDNPEQAWEPERVQLCAQGLILRENGYRCERGQLYYIESRHRVTVEFDDALVMRTRQLIRELRELAASQRLPPPLVDSPKCPRCSLVGICLPDETNLFLRGDVHPDPGNESCSSSVHDSNETSAVLTSRVSAVAVSTTPVRRLLPARDDALPLYVKEQGAFVGKDGDRLVVRHREAKLMSVPMMEISQVSLFGNVQMSAQALREVVDRGIPVCHFSYGGWFAAMTTGHDHKNVELRIAQFATAADAQKSLALARNLIAAKIKNCRTMLRRHSKNRQDPGSVDPKEDSEPTANAIAVEATRDQDVPAWRAGDVNPLMNAIADEATVNRDRTNGADSTSNRDLEQLAEWGQKAMRASSAETLLGLEGMAAKVYFAGFAKILKGGETFEFSGRNRRPPRDPINAVLSFVYALLAKELTIAVRAVGFDPLLGFFHKPRYGRPSLALDLAEEFRPIIGDSTVLMLVNNGEVTASSFLSRAGSVALTEAGRKAVIAAFERRMEQEITHPIFGYKLSYRRILEVQARLLSRVVLGELPEYPGFCTR